MAKAFNDTSTNGPTSWNWSFGDGSYSASQNPTHTYVNDGTYTVNFTATNYLGSVKTSSTVSISRPLSIDDYYYGDSITAGLGPNGNLNIYGADTFGLQMNRLYTPSRSAGHNIDGPGKNSTWLLMNAPTHPGLNVSRLFVMGGANDLPYNIYGDETGRNLEGMYNFYQANGTEVFILLTLIPVNGTRGSSTFEDWLSNITITRNYLTSKGITSSVIIHDAIDNTPNNGILNPANASNYYDAITHPNYNGHTLMANYLWGNITPTTSFTLDKSLVLIPQAITANSTSTNSPTLLNWSWGDGDWSNLTVSVDGVAATHYYTATGAYPVYLTACNAAGCNQSANQSVRVTELPAAISNLTNTTPSQSEVTWNWDNPTSPDFGVTMIFQNGTFWTNNSNLTSSRTWTNLGSGTNMTFSSRTCNIFEMCNNTWVNKTIKTAGYGPDCPTPTPTPTPPPMAPGGSGPQSAGSNVALALSIISLALIVVGAAVVITAAKKVSQPQRQDEPSPIVPIIGGIVLIGIGAVLLYVAYAAFAPIFALSGV